MGQDKKETNINNQLNKFFGHLMSIESFEDRGTELNKLIRRLKNMESTNNTLDSVFGEVISSYSRKQAIEDGFLADVSHLEVTKEHFKIPVALTAKVWGIVDKAVKNKRWFNDLEGVLHDIFFMYRTTGNKNSSESLFPVIITGAGRKRNFVFKAVHHQGDDGEHVLTIMSPEED